MKLNMCRYGTLRNKYFCTKIAKIIYENSNNIFYIKSQLVACQICENTNVEEDNANRSDFVLNFQKRLWRGV